MLLKSLGLKKETVFLKCNMTFSFMFDEITWVQPCSSLTQTLLFYYRNGTNVEGATHRQVVDLIKSGGDVLTLTVISVSPQVRLVVLIKS